MKSIYKTFIIIVNYNSWKDTIICLEDLKQKHWENIEVVLVDNCSTDNSVISIENYLSGRDLSFLKENFSKLKKSKSKNLKIHFLKSSSNNGFAYGNNIGIKYAQTLYNKNFYIWMLNNDTVVEDDCLQEFISFFESDNYGLIGSKLLDFDPPHEIQSLYGSFNKITGRVKVINKINSKSRLSYPIGASMFTSSEIIKNVGLLNEEYFLYYEEMDYSERVKKNNYKIGVCLDSIVYHKQGASTKSFEKGKEKNLLMESYKYEGLLKFYRKHHKSYILGGFIGLILKSIKLILKGEFRNSKLIFSTIIKNLKF